MPEQDGFVFALTARFCAGDNLAKLAVHGVFG